MKPPGFYYTRPFQRLLDALPPHPVIVEVGTAHQLTLPEQLGSGMSTVAWAEHVRKHGGSVHTIDIAKEHIATCAIILQQWLGSYQGVQFYEGEGAAIIAQLVPRLHQIDLLYVDGNIGGQEAAAQVRAALPALQRAGGLVAFDDCPDPNADATPWFNPQLRVSAVWARPMEYHLRFAWHEGLIVAFQTLPT